MLRDATEDSDTFNPIVFQLKALKIFGAIQMILGGIITLIGIISLSLDQSEKNCKFDIEFTVFNVDVGCENRSKKIIGMDGAWLGLSLWVVITGVIPLFMTKKNEYQWRSLKLAFAVCSVIGAAAVVPTIGILGLVSLIYRYLTPWALDTEARAIAIMIAAFLTFVMTITTCSYSLCCGKENGQRQAIDINIANVVPGQMTGQMAGYQLPLGYQPNPYLQDQMSSQFITGPGQYPGNRAALSGYPQYPAVQYGMIPNQHPAVESSNKLQIQEC
ncbi:unnamed protein product [Mytilus coruscus]|uniref:Uncharacterized protein n=1 Tax=Mytilus coruscus TaxID=42192 RepID=A0A6J8F512_MYTCO|nr:unnamed protein product [Mytilus coruscus]